MEQGEIFVSLFKMVWTEYAKQEKGSRNSARGGTWAINRVEKEEMKEWNPKW